MEAFPDKPNPRFIARWIRQLPRTPPDNRRVPHVVAHLFKVTPPMTCTDMVTFRNGKMLHGKRRSKSRIRRMKKATEDLKSHMEEPGKRIPGIRRTTTRWIDRKTSFVVASASDLKTFMAESNKMMIDSARARGDMETVRLFEKDMGFEVETYLFPANKYGEIKSYNELPGSQRGTLDHRVPFNDVGYTVVNFNPSPIPPGVSPDSIEAQIAVAVHENIT